MLSQVPECLRAGRGGGKVPWGGGASKAGASAKKPVHFLPRPYMALRLHLNGAILGTGRLGQHRAPGALGLEYGSVGWL